MPGALFVKGTDMPEEQQNLFSGDELAAQATDPAARIEALRREIEHNSYLYYALDAPAISDGAFDSLMHELRAIGATNADPQRSRSLTGKAHLRRVVDAYEPLRSNGLLPATYEVVYAQAWAPDAGQPRRSGNQDIASFPIDQLRGSRRIRR